MLNEKENYLEAMRSGNPDHVPYGSTATYMCGLLPFSIIEIPLMGGEDSFGVKYDATADGPLPANTEFALDDITKWKEVVKFPDLDAYPWEEWAEAENVAGIDRTNRLVYCMIAQGLFDRLIAFMGFENGLIAMVEEPEACDEFFAAVAEQHTCGKCEDIIADYVEMGISVWFPAQTCNDLSAIKERYKGNLALNHGMDSQGHLGKPGITEEILRSEVRKTVDKYAEGGGIIITPVIMGITMEDCHLRV
jgi:hypothetical protein